jgi:uncharacterized membrane protein YhaH (DUF805 family)
MNALTSAILEPWIRAFDFAGRSRRREYFIFYAELIVAVISVILIFGGRIDENSFERIPSVVQISLGVLVLISILPSLSLHVRRLHDQNRSGWWFFISALPFVGHFIMLVLMLWNGTPGDNRFGHNPRRQSTSL